jgi:hypothetical protein
MARDAETKPNSQSIVVVVMFILHSIKAITKTLLLG